MGDPPLVSVVVPSYHQGRFLRECLCSVVGQRYPRVELMVVDGGSGEESLDVLRELGEHLSWWVSEPDRGQAHAVNKGLARATGDLVAFVGADDVYLPGAFADAAARFASRPETGAVVGGFVRIDESSLVIGGPVAARVPGPGPFDPMTARPGSWRLHQVSTFYTRGALDAVGRHVDESLCYTMDRELLNRVARRFPVVTSPRVYAAFRHHAASKSTADILPFSRELAALHLRDVPAGEPALLLRRRRALARRQLAGGWLKLARSEASPTPRVLALLRALAFRPSLLGTRSYAARWLEALGLKAPHVPHPRPLHEVIDEL